MATIREQFEQAKADFAAAFKEGDAEKAKQAGELAEKYEALVNMADEKGALLNAQNEVKHDAKEQTFGEWAAKSLDLSGFKGRGRGSVATADSFTKAAADTQVKPDAAGIFDTYYDQNIVTGPRRRLQIRDLFGAETRDASSVEYLVEGALEGNTGVSKEAAKGNQFHFADPEKKNVALEKVFGFYKESYEIVNDEAWLASSLNTRGLYIHDLFVEDKLVTDLGAASGVQIATATADTLADTIFTAITNVSEATPFMADSVVMNPAEYQTLRLAKDKNGQYMGGGYFSGAYTGANGVTLYPDVWGMTTVVTPAVASGTVYVGAFAAGGSVFTKAGEGLRVEMTNADADDFEHDLIAVRIIERLALALRYPAAFDKLTVSAGA